MAKITLTDANLNWVEYQLTQQVDRAIVRSGALKNNFYSSGAAKTRLQGTLVARTPAQRRYMEGTILAAFYEGDTIEFTPPDVHFNFVGTATEGMRTSAAVGAGSTSIDIEDNAGNTFNGTIPSGTWITFANHDGTYVVNAFDDAAQRLTIRPNLRAEVPDMTAITYDGIKLHMEFVSAEVSYGINRANDTYLTLRLNLEEIV